MTECAGAWLFEIPISCGSMRAAESLFSSSRFASNKARAPTFWSFLLTAFFARTCVAVPSIFETKVCWSQGSKVAQVQVRLEDCWVAKFGAPSLSAQKVCHPSVAKPLDTSIGVSCCCHRVGFDRMIWLRPLSNMYDTFEVRLRWHEAGECHTERN